MGSQTQENIFWKNAFTRMTKHWKYFSSVFSRTQTNIWKYFPFRKIFSIKNILHSENILHVTKHHLSQPRLSTLICTQTLIIVEATKTKGRWRGSYFQCKDKRGSPILNVCFSWSICNKTTVVMLAINKAIKQIQMTQLPGVLIMLTSKEVRLLGKKKFKN